MSRPHISTKQLQKIAHHISYEIEMFEYAGGRIKQGGLDQGENNVMLEAFLIHARCLFDFLYPSKIIRFDDVVADDFFVNPNELRDKLAEKLDIADYLKSRTGKEIAHITYKRIKITPIQKVWQVGEVHDQIGGELVVFFEALTQEQRSWFPKIIIK